MSKSIRLSPKHGLNPSISACFFCGEDKNEIILAGKLDKEDTEMPRSIVMNYEPCDKCKEQMAQGITLIGVSTEPLPDNRPEISKGLYPTGAWCVVSEDFASRFFTSDVLNQVLEYRKCYIPHDTIIALIHSAENTEE